MYQPPSASRRSGASPAIVMTICEKKEKKSADKNIEAPRADSQMSIDGGRAHGTSQEIIDKSAVMGGGKTKKQWLCSPGLYKVRA